MAQHGTNSAGLGARVDWESKFTRWALPPGSTEQSRCQNAERAIKNALSRYEALECRDIRVFTQGSYRNRVNISKESDVDIGVLCMDIFHPSYPEGVSAKNFGHVDANDYSYAHFKQEVGEALASYFGSESVSRGGKAYSVRENSYHVEADVAPFIEHRRYTSGGLYHSGVLLWPDGSPYTRVINWPEQHYENGVEKNSNTQRRYKGVVRIVKSLRAKMASDGVDAAQEIPGFLIECLVWNVPNSEFGMGSWTADVRSALAYLWNNTRSDEGCLEWGEVSELKYLFRGSQPWTRVHAHRFLDAAWNYLGFE